MKEPAQGVRDKTAAWFAGMFAVYLVAGVVLLDAAPFQEWFVQPWTRLNTVASAALMTLVGVETTTSGTLVVSGSARLNVLDGCNGLHALLILLACILSFPTSWPRRAAGAAAGAVGVLGVNLVRLCNLIFVGRYHPHQLELFHVYIWQVLIILLALVIFAIWANYFTKS